MEEERDVVVFTDEDGNEFELDVIDYFEYEGEEYAVLTELEAECDCDEEDCECEHDVFIMKIVVDGEFENFVPAADDKMDVLTAIVEKRLEELEDAWDDDEDGEEHTHEHTDAFPHED